MTSHNGFQWPTEGPVEAPDWDPSPVCGSGLHGLLKGCGEIYLLNWSEDAKWVVFSAYEDEVVDLDGKVKVPRGEVVLCGTREEAISFLVKKYPRIPIVGATVVVGNKDVAAVGDKGTAVSGNEGASTVGDFGIAVSKDNGEATAKYGGVAITRSYGEATTEDCGISISGRFGRSTARNHGKAITGYGGISTVGRRGRAISGDLGVSRAGDFGAAFAGVNGRVAAGQEGRIQLEYNSDEYNRHIKIITGYIGEDGLKPNVFYELDENHQFVEVQEMTGDSDETEE
jgi:hypothetical protein